MQALDLHVHDGVGIQGEVVVSQGKPGKTALVFQLYLVDPGSHLGVAGKVGQLDELLGLEQVIVIAQQLHYQAMEAGVYLAEPAAVVDAVGHVGESLGVQGADVLEQVVFQNFPVEAGHAVDLVAGGKAHVGHMDLAVADYHVAAHLLIAAEAAYQVLAPAAVYLAHYLPEAGQQLLHQGLGPLLQGLGHDGVVGIGHAALDYLPGLVPAQLIFVHEYAHQLGDYQGGVGVVYLDGVVLGKAAYVPPLFDVLADYVLGGGGDEEVLLL